MNPYALGHLDDPALDRSLEAAFARRHGATAVVLAHLAELDSRKLYVPAGYPSMCAYCVGRWRMSEQAALRRIRAARTARRFPAIFAALADDRLNLTAVLLLAPYLTEANAAGLLTAAAGKSNDDVEKLLAQRFPGTELMAWVRPLSSAQPPCELSAATVEAPARELSAATVEAPTGQLSVATVGQCVPRRVAKLAPLAAERYELQATIDRQAHDDLQYCQAMLGHPSPAAEIGAVLGRALKALAHELRKLKFAATSRPQAKPRATRSRRHVPAHVRRAVSNRDRDQCTFVSEGGHRCQARSRLEFDHIEPVARGGQTTAENIRLRCRAHKQYAAEQTFGTAFMRHKREEAQRAAEEKRKAAGTSAYATR